MLDPLKLVIDNYPDDITEEIEAEYHPDHPEYGTRKMPFSKELYIERSDFMAEPIKKYFRLFPAMRFAFSRLISLHAQDMTRMKTAM